MNEEYLQDGRMKSLVVNLEKPEELRKTTVAPAQMLRDEKNEALMEGLRERFQENSWIRTAKLPEDAAMERMMDEAYGEMFAGRSLSISQKWKRGKKFKDKAKRQARVMQEMADHYWHRKDLMEELSFLHGHESASTNIKAVKPEEYPEYILDWETHLYKSGKSLHSVRMLHQDFVNQDHEKKASFYDQMLKEVALSDVSDFEYKNDSQFADGLMEKYERLKAYAHTRELIEMMEKNGVQSDYVTEELRAKAWLYRDMLKDYEQRMELMQSPYYVLLAGKDFDKLPKDRLDRMYENANERARQYLDINMERKKSRSFGKGMDAREMLSTEILRLRMEGDVSRLKEGEELKGTGEQIRKGLEVCEEMKQMLEQNEEMRKDFSDLEEGSMQKLDRKLEEEEKRLSEEYKGKEPDVIRLHVKYGTETLRGQRKILEYEYKSTYEKAGWVLPAYIRDIQSDEEYLREGERVLKKESLDIIDRTAIEEKLRLKVEEIRQNKLDLAKFLAEQELDRSSMIHGQAYRGYHFEPGDEAFETVEAMKKNVEMNDPIEISGQDFKERLMFPAHRKGIRIKNEKIRTDLDISSISFLFYIKKEDALERIGNLRETMLEYAALEMCLVRDTGDKYKTKLLEGRFKRIQNELADQLFNLKGVSDIYHFKK